MTVTWQSHDMMQEKEVVPLVMYSPLMSVTAMLCREELVARILAVKWLSHLPGSKIAHVDGLVILNSVDRQ